MKKIITITAALFVAFFATNSVANAQDNDIEINATQQFTETMVNVPAKIIYMESDQYGVSINSNNQNVENYVNYSVEDGTLKITAKNENMRKIENADVEIIISSPKTPSVQTSGDFEKLGNK